MTVYSGPVFDMAVNQFEVIANHLSIPTYKRERLLPPTQATTHTDPTQPTHTRTGGPEAQRQ